MKIPYVKELEHFNNNFFKKYRTKDVYSARNKLNNIIKLGKDKNDKSNNSNVVYKINCNDCNASYVGQTSRRVNVRIKEHIKNTPIKIQFLDYFHISKIIII